MLGTPVSVGSIATAIRSARASDLNIASMMWWAFVPASTVTWSVSFAFAASGPEELLDELVVEVPDRAGRQRRAEREQTTTGDIDRGRRTRLIHRHRRLSVTDDADPVAERLIKRLTDADADVLDGVVRTRLEVARGGDG